MTQGKTDKLYDVVHYASKQPNAAKMATIAFAKPMALAKWLKRTVSQFYRKTGTQSLKRLNKIFIEQLLFPAELQDEQLLLAHQM